jgi:hypothetical protein
MMLVFLKKPGGCAMRPLRKGECSARVSPVAWRTLLLVSLALCPLSGCAGGDGLTAPTYSPDQAAQEAMTQYDTNHDGFLDAKELERCPALKQGLDTIDKNGDHRLNAEEIAGRIQIYQDSQVALKAVGCHVQLDGRPLAGATVTYVPEKFMGSSIKPATGVSDDQGGVQLKVAGENLPGVQPGLYRVQVSKMNASGQETIPARYNQDTILGAEVYPRKIRKMGARDNDTGDFRLSSKSK